MGETDRDEERGEGRAKTCTVTKGFIVLLQCKKLASNEGYVNSLLLIDKNQTWVQNVFRRFPCTVPMIQEGVVNHFPQRNTIYIRL